MERNFNHKVIDMLVAALIICQNFIKFKLEIITFRPQWADPFITDHETRIKNVIKNRIGLNPVSLQKITTIGIENIVKEAVNKFSTFKIQLNVDFADDKTRLNWILDTLGFTQFFDSVKGKDQEILIQFLARFSDGMTPELKTEIYNKGMTPGLIEEIIDIANIAADADVLQETKKGDTKLTIEESTIEFNNIYTTSIGICKILHNKYKDDKTKAEMFSFNHIIKTMNNG